MRLGKSLVIYCFVLAGFCRAADEAVTVDFSAGFNQLAALGLPDLPAEAKWSVLPESIADNRENEEEQPNGLKGGGWLFPEEKDQKRQALAMGSVVVADIDPEAEKVEGASSGFLGRMLGGGKKKEPASTDADLAKDVKVLRDGLKELKALRNGGSVFDEDSYEVKQRATTFGRLLIFATQIHQSGDDKLANELVGSLFEIFPNREAIVDAAINRIADQLYSKAIGSFYQTKDWKIYHKEVLALVARFPRGWDKHAAAALLLEPLSRRATGDSPPEIKLEGVPLEPEAVASVKWMTEESSPGKVGPSIPPEIEAQLAGLPAKYRAQYLRAMMNGGGSSFGNSRGNWLLDKPGKSEKPKESSDVAEPTLKLGVAALPVLAALLDDSYLTAHPNPQGGSGSYYSSDESSTERMLMEYRNMDRPASRGELAKNLLQSTLPDPERENDSADPEVLRDLAVEFWKQHQKDSPDGIAIAFLREGSQEQKNEAAKLLAASSDPAVLKVFEKSVLDDASPAANLMIVRTYLQHRKSAAKPFLDLYVKALREELGDGTNLENHNELPYEIQRMKNIEPLIKQLESQVSGKSPQARAREIAKEDPKSARTAIPEFIKSMSEETPRHRLLALLAGAVAAEDPSVRALFINSIFQLRYAGQDEPEEESAPSEGRTLPPGESQAWETLLADERVLPDATTRRRNEDGKSLGDLAAIALEYSVEPGAMQKLQEASTVTGKDLAVLSLPRAKARLAGQPIPSLPDATKITPARLAEIVSTAGAEAPLEIHPYLKKLTDDERAAWLHWYNDPGELAIPENVAKLKRIITARWTDSWMGKDVPANSEIDVGFEVTKESIEKSVQRLAEDFNARSRLMVSISNAAFPPGLRVAASKIEMPTKKPEESNGEEADPFSANSESLHSPRSLFRNILNDFKSSDFPQEASGVVFASISGSDRGSSSFWRIINGKPVMKKSDEDPKDVLTALAETPGDDDQLYLQIQILSRADAEVLNKPE